MNTPFTHSLELRWFFEASEDTRERLHAWYTLQDSLPVARERGKATNKESALLLEETPRVDEYLAWTGCDTAGVKQRDGRLEIKARTSEPAPYAFPGYSVAGLSDEWVKWTFSPKHIQPFRSELQASTPWRAVQKQRMLQAFVWNGQAAEGAPAGTDPEAGGQAELTVLRLDAARADWITLGFKTWGPRPELARILQATVEAFFVSRGASPLALTGASSRSYPAWLVDFSD